jgi:hypothetical protein
MTDSDAGDTARYAIRVTGALGPVLRCSLRRKGVVRLESTPTTSTVNVRVCDADLVDIAQRFADRGIEIDSVREVGTAAG